MGGKAPKAPPKPAPVAVPTESDTAEVKRGAQQEALKKKQKQQTLFGGAPAVKNTLG